MNEIEKLTTMIREFAQSRDWERFQTPKNLAMELSVEVAEVVEPFRWLTAEESTALVYATEGRAAIEDEIADIAIHPLRLADVLEVDVAKVIQTKHETNDRRFAQRE